MSDTRNAPSTPIDGTDSSNRHPTDTSATATERTAAAGSAIANNRAATTERAAATERSVTTEHGAAADHRATGDRPRAAATPRGDSHEVAVGYRRYGSALRVIGGFALGAPFVALVAAVEVAIATVLLGVPWSTAPLSVGLIAFAVYATDHVADADLDVGSTPVRANLARRYGDQLLTAAAASYGLAVALAVAAGPAALALALIPGAVWIGYGSDWLPATGRLVAPIARLSVPRVKDVFLLNSAAVALAWAVSVALAPLAFGGVPFGSAVDPTLAVVFGYVFLRSFVDVEVPNVRDVEADAANGVATLPVVCGVDGTRAVLLAVDAVAAGLLAAAGATGLLPWSAVAALGAGLAVSVSVTALADRLGDRALGVASDGSYLVAGLALLAVGV